MIRWARLCGAAVASLLLAACNLVDNRDSVSEPYLPDDSAVAFDLEPLKSSGGLEQWVGIYNSHGKTARFRIEFESAKFVPGKTAAEFGIKSGEGRLAPEPGSDSSVLLADLKEALQAKAVPQPPRKKISIPFTYVNIGDNFSQARGGGFSGNPPGNWTALKLFFGEGDQEAQIFLNLNARIKKGQFSMKDPDYGDLVLVELAKVL